MIQVSKVPRVMLESKARMARMEIAAYKVYKASLVRTVHRGSKVPEAPAAQQDPLAPTVRAVTEVPTGVRVTGEREAVRAREVHADSRDHLDSHSEASHLLSKYSPNILTDL